MRRLRGKSRSPRAPLAACTPRLSRRSIPRGACIPCGKCHFTGTCQCSPLKTNDSKLNAKPTTKQIK